MAKIVKQAKADIYLRDTDSQSLYTNSGVLLFKYYHEWNDCYNPKTGETAQIDGEVYDEVTGAYKPNCPDGFSPVFNGRLSALWDNMVSCFPDKIQEMYKTMRDGGLSYKGMMAKYKELWRYWCENLYNADAFGYANTDNFTKAYGDKVQVMDYFFQKRQRYLDSKYCCGSSASNNLRLRLYETGKGLAIKYYQAIYSSLQWGANNFSTQRNIHPGTYSYMPFGFSNPQDATFDIDDADLITELSTYVKTSAGYVVSGLEGLGDFKFDLNMGLLKRLTKFVMNYTASKPNTKELGDSFDMSGMVLLRQVIVRNVVNLSKSIVINSDIVEEIDFTNTPIVGVTTPPSDSLTRLVLPSTITSLRLNGYTHLLPSGLQVAGYSNIDVLEVEDCPNLNSYEILKNCYDAGAPLTNVTLRGIDWSLDGIDLLVYLAQKKANLQGRIVIDGSVAVRLSSVLAFYEAWGDVTSESNGLYIQFASNEMTRVSVNGKNYLDKKGEYRYEVAPYPVSGNNVKEVSWSISENDFADISKDGVLTVKSIGSEASDDKATISLSVTLTNGDVLSNTKEVRFYKKACAVGDYLFSDGTYGGSLDDSKCSPVGVVFYIDPSDGKNALAVSLSAYGSRVWGLYNSTDANNGMSGIKLTDSPYMNVYDVKAIPDFTAGVNVTESSMIDETKKDGFKEYSVLNSISNMGFVKVTQDIYDELSLYLDRIGLSVGDMISTGQLYTIRIISHRDTILRDSGVNLPVPKASGEITEAQSLASCISSIIAMGNKYQQYYFPAASYCFAYQPTNLKSGEELADCVKANRWFLPSIGEMSRLSWYAKNGCNYENKYSIFSNSFADNVFKKFGNEWYWSSSEYSENVAWDICPLSGQGYNDGLSRCNAYTVRPVVAFRP